LKRRKRFFVLTEAKEMRYFDEYGEVKGLFSVEKAFVSKAPESKKKPNCFQIECSNRTYYLSAESVNVMSEWVDALESVGAKIKKEIGEGVVFRVNYFY